MGAGFEVGLSHIAEEAYDIPEGKTVPLYVEQADGTKILIGEARLERTNRGLVMDGEVDEEWAPLFRWNGPISIAEDDDV